MFLISSWSVFGWLATPGKHHSCSMFYTFVVNGSHWFSGVPETALQPFLDFFKFLNFFRSGDNVLHSETTYFMLSDSFYVSDLLNRQVRHSSDLGLTSEIEPGFPKM